MSTHVHRGDRDHTNDGGAMPGHVSKRCQVDLVRKKMLLTQLRLDGGCSMLGEKEQSLLSAAADARQKIVVLGDSDMILKKQSPQAPTTGLGAQSVVSGGCPMPVHLWVRSEFRDLVMKLLDSCMSNHT